MTVVLCSILVFALTLDLIILWLWPSNKKALKLQTAIDPVVTIMIPIRNEVDNVPGMIENLLRLDYPSNKLQILLGEDRSEDGTLDLLKKLSSHDPRFKIIQINQDLPSLIGKGNVLGQLIPYASGEYLFITDADVKVPKGWLRSMLEHVDSETGVLGGCTVVVGENLWSQLQNTDWLLAQALLFTVDARYQTLAVSGTNMMITQTACKAIGGYENIPYSLTEDIGFLTAAKRQGVKTKNAWGTGTMAKILPQRDWSTLLKQRARWTYGALRLPIMAVVPLVLRASFLPTLVVWAFWQPWFALTFLGLRIVVQSIIVKKIATQLEQRVQLLALLLFEVYYALVTLGGVILYLIPVKISWKGRKYK